jgi:hypothetical protein
MQAASRVNKKMVSNLHALLCIMPGTLFTIRSTIIILLMLRCVMHTHSACLMANCRKLHAPLSSYPDKRKAEREENIPLYISKIYIKFEEMKYHEFKKLKMLHDLKKWLVRCAAV